MTRRLAVLGCGVMGESLVAGLLQAGWDPADIVIVERSEVDATELTKRYDVAVSTDTAEAVASAATIVLAVKPQDVLQALTGVSWRPDQLLISVCAGIRIELLEQLAPGVPVVRSMPNIAVRSRAGATAICGGSHTGEAELATAEHILNAVGSAVRVPERLFDAVTALSGNGPAYLFLLAEAMVDAGVNCGLSRDVADTLTRQTLFGASTMLREADSSATELRHGVTSPAGTTVAALRVFESNRFRSTIADAFSAAVDRSRELGDDLTSAAQHRGTAR